jgi:hypothetical protein
VRHNVAPYGVVGSIIGLSVIVLTIVVLVVPFDCLCPFTIDDECQCSNINKCFWECKQIGSDESVCYNYSKVVECLPDP